MNTPAHLIVAAAAFAHPERERGDGAAKVTFAALFGAILPDLSLYLLFAWARFVQGRSPQQIFNIDYFSDAWQAVFAVDNSIPLWVLVLALAIALRSAIGVAFAGSGLLHLVTDFLLHNDDARRHLWPLSDWVFVSPVSYWDPAHYGHIAGPVEALMCFVLLAMLWQRFSGWVARGALLIAGALELLPAGAFAIMFAG